MDLKEPQNINDSFKYIPPLHVMVRALFAIITKRYPSMIYVESGLNKK